MVAGASVVEGQGGAGVLVAQPQSLGGGLACFPSSYSVPLRAYPNYCQSQSPARRPTSQHHPIPTVRSCDRGIHKPLLAPPVRVSPLPASAGLAAPPNPSSPLRRPKQQDGEGTHRPARAALRPRHHPRIQEVQVEPVRVRLAGADRGGEHQGGRRVVRRQADGVRLQGQDQEQRHPLPLHLGQGLPPSRQHRSSPRQVHLQPAGRSHGAQGQDLHVPEQHLKVRIE